jgi:hypothetical protein
MRDRIIEAIFDALPANNYQEIADKVSRIMRRPVGESAVSNALTHLRSNSAEYGWTVPHVQRGTGEGERFIMLLVDRDGHYELDSNPAALDHIKDGGIGTLRQIATMMQNQTAAFQIAVTHTRKINTRAHLSDLADDFLYIARKAAAAVREMENDADAA